MARKYLRYLPVLFILLALALMLRPVLPQWVLVGPDNQWVEYRSYFSYEQEWIAFPERLLLAPARALFTALLWLAAWATLCWFRGRNRGFQPYRAALPAAVALIPGLPAVASAFQTLSVLEPPDCPAVYLITLLLALALLIQLVDIWQEYYWIQRGAKL